MMDGRLKTLHPKVHGGILCRHDNPEDMQAAGRARHPHVRAGGREPLSVRGHRRQAGRDARRGDREDRHRRADDGPRGGARTTPSRPSPPSPEQYGRFSTQVAADGCTTLELRRRLAGEAFAHTARYDRAIADLLRRLHGRRRLSPARLPWACGGRRCCATARTRTSRRRLYVRTPPATAQRRRRRASSTARSFRTTTCWIWTAPWRSSAIVRRAGGVVIKHNNPCGAAVADTLAEALRRAMAGDPLSAFGSVLGLNRTVDAATAEVLCRAGAVRRGDRRPRLRRPRPWRSSPRGPSGRPTCG